MKPTYLFLLALTPAFATPVVTVTVPATASVGDSVTANIDISGVSDLFGFQFDLTFNPAVLNATSTPEGPFLPAGGATFYIDGTIDNTRGTVTAVADTLFIPPGVSGGGTLASVVFTAMGAGASALTLSNVLLIDSSLNPIDATLTGGSITVSGTATAAPEPSTTLLIALGLAVVSLRARRGSSPARCR